jgi:hypothetical protein
MFRFTPRCNCNLCACVEGDVRFIYSATGTGSAYAYPILTKYHTDYVECDDGVLLPDIYPGDNTCNVQGTGCNCVGMPKYTNGVMRLYDSDYNLIQDNLVADNVYMISGAISHAIYTNTPVAYGYGLYIDKSYLEYNYDTNITVSGSGYFYPGYFQPQSPIGWSDNYWTGDILKLPIKPLTYNEEDHYINPFTETISHNTELGVIITGSCPTGYGTLTIDCTYDGTSYIPTSSIYVENAKNWIDGMFDGYSILLYKHTYPYSTYYYYEYSTIVHNTTNTLFLSPFNFGNFYGYTGAISGIPYGDLIYKCDWYIRTSSGMSDDLFHQLGCLSGNIFFQNSTGVLYDKVFDVILAGQYPFIYTYGGTQQTGLYYNVDSIISGVSHDYDEYFQYIFPNTFSGTNNNGAVVLNHGALLPYQLYSSTGEKYVDFGIGVQSGEYLFLREMPTGGILPDLTDKYITINNELFPVSGNTSNSITISGGLYNQNYFFDMRNSSLDPWTLDNGDMDIGRPCVVGEGFQYSTTDSIPITSRSTYIGNGKASYKNLAFSPLSNYSVEYTPYPDVFTNTNTPSGIFNSTITSATGNLTGLYNYANIALSYPYFSGQNGSSYKLYFGSNGDYCLESIFNYKTYIIHDVRCNDLYDTLTWGRQIYCDSKFTYKGTTLASKNNIPGLINKVYIVYDKEVVRLIAGTLSANGHTDVVNACDNGSAMTDLTDLISTVDIDDFNKGDVKFSVECQGANGNLIGFNRLIVNCGPKCYVAYTDSVQPQPCCFDESIRGANGITILDYIDNYSPSVNISTFPIVEYEGNGSGPSLQPACFVRYGGATIGGETYTSNCTVRTSQNVVEYSLTYATGGEPIINVGGGNIIFNAQYPSDQTVYYENYYDPCATGGGNDFYTLYYKYSSNSIKASGTGITSIGSNQYVLGSGGYAYNIEDVMEDGIFGYYAHSYESVVYPFIFSLLPQYTYLLDLSNYTDQYMILNPHFGKFYPASFSTNMPRCVYTYVTPYGQLAKFSEDLSQYQPNMFDFNNEALPVQKNTAVTTGALGPIKKFRDDAVATFTYNPSILCSDVSNSDYYCLPYYKGGACCMPDLVGNFAGYTEHHILETYGYPIEYYKLCGTLVSFGCAITVGNYNLQNTNNIPYFFSAQSVTANTWTNGLSLIKDSNGKYRFSYSSWLSDPFDDPINFNSFGSVVLNYIPYDVFYDNRAGDSTWYVENILHGGTTLTIEIDSGQYKAPTASTYTSMDITLEKSPTDSCHHWGPQPIVGINCIREPDATFYRVIHGGGYVSSCKNGDNINGQIYNFPSGWGYLVSQIVSEKYFYAGLQDGQTWSFPNDGIGLAPYYESVSVAEYAYDSSVTINSTIYIINNYRINSIVQGYIATKHYPNGEYYYELESGPTEVYMASAMYSNNLESKLQVTFPTITNRDYPAYHIYPETYYLGTINCGSCEAICSGHDSNCCYSVDLSSFMKIIRTIHY